MAQSELELQMCHLHKYSLVQSKGVDSHVAQTEPLERGYNNYLSN